MISLMVSVDAKYRETRRLRCVSELRNCVKVEVAVLGSQCVISLMVSVDAKYREGRRLRCVSELWSCVTEEVDA